MLITSSFWFESLFYATIRDAMPWCIVVLMFFELYEPRYRYEFGIAMAAQPMEFML